MERNTCQGLIEDFSNSTFYPGNSKKNCGTPTNSAENHILTFLWYKLKMWKIIKQK